MKIKDVTPVSFSCKGASCPAIYETDSGTYLIIGKKVESSEAILPGKIGQNETMVEVPVDLIRGVD